MLRFDPHDRQRGEQGRKGRHAGLTVVTEVQAHQFGPAGKLFQLGHAAFVDFTIVAGIREDFDNGIIVLQRALFDFSGAIKLRLSATGGCMT